MGNDNRLRNTKLPLFCFSFVFSFQRVAGIDWIVERYLDDIGLQISKLSNEEPGLPSFQDLEG
jgi:hypothetical protein